MDSRELLRAKRNADYCIEAELGITYDFDQMEYVDANGTITPSEHVAKIRREQMEQQLGYKLPD